MADFKLAAVPAGFDWKFTPLDWKTEGENVLTIRAGEKTDWFIDPAGSDYNTDTAPCALFTPPDENFILSAKVKVGFASTFDAGTIQLRAGENLWAKFCFEYSPQHQPMIVSVVTREVSDDCNSAVIDGNEIYLRAAVMPSLMAFHYSHDGKIWNMVRYFSLGKTENLKVGFSAQSPTGKECTAIFSEIEYKSGLLDDFRNGE